MKKEKIVLDLLRYALSFIFLWAFFDKVFGLGFATAPDKSWIHGGSPTTGFLANAVQGPFMSFFHSLSGMPVVDWLFMGGLLFVGLTLALNKYLKLGCMAGVLMLLSMYLALLFPANNPIIDEHIVYILVLLLIAFKSENK
jgi:thiosulfate dehydrogenase [quinone] large subunit